MIISPELQRSISALKRHPVITASVLVFGGVILYYRTVVVRPASLYCKKTSKFHSLLKSMPILNERYWPPIWCFEGRLQTVLATFIRSLIVQKVEYQRKVLSLKDGGQVALDFLDRSEQRLNNKNYSGPIILILPGLTGSSQSDYISNMVNVTSQKLDGLYVVFNYRGRGGLCLTTPRTYCATNTDDLEEVLNFLCKTYPNADILAAGVSLGGIILTQYLCKLGEEARKKLLAGFVMSICFNIKKGVVSLERPYLNLCLNWNLASGLVEAVKQVFSSKTLREFDSRYTAPMFGYKSVNNYYAEATVAGKLNKIRIPLLALNANDDPFQPGNYTPTKEAGRTEFVAIITTEYGGHIGFMEGILGLSRLHFSDRLFGQFVKSVFQEKDTLKQMYVSE